VDRTGNDPAVFQNEVQRAIKNGIVSERMAAPYLEAAQRDPSHVAKVTGALLGKEPAKPIEHDPTKALLDPQDPTKVIVPAAPKPLEHSAAYKEWQDAVSTGYGGSFTQYQNEDANRKKPSVNVSGMGSMYAQTDPKAIADGIADGSLPPTLTEYGRAVQGAVATQLRANGFNLAQAATDWEGHAKTHSHAKRRPAIEAQSSGQCAA
jgi:hypothetical protein